jgi:hypothetical protein
MKFSRWMALAAIAVSSTAFSAQDKPHNMDPSHPDAPASVARYQSAFEGYRVIADSDEVPEQVWRAANAEVGAIGSHAGHGNSQTATPAAGPGRHSGMQH